MTADRRRRDGGDGQLTEGERAELVRLRKENAGLQTERDVLKRNVALWVTDRPADGAARRTGLRQEHRASGRIIKL